MHRHEIGVICCITVFSSVCLLTFLIPLLLSVLLPNLLLCGFGGMEHVTNILHVMCAHWNEASSCFLSFRVGQSPMNVHLIILFRERQAWQALVWWWECCFFDFFLNLTRTSNCMFSCIFMLHLDEDAFGQPSYCNRNYRKRAKELNYREDQTSAGLCFHNYPSQHLWNLLNLWSFIPEGDWTIFWVSKNKNFLTFLGLDTKRWNENYKPPETLLKGHWVICIYPPSSTNSSCWKTDASHSCFFLNHVNLWSDKEAMCTQQEPASGFKKGPVCRI